MYKALFSKYILVGILNTGITAVIIFILMSFGYGIYTANSIGYLVGIVVSFILNSVYTFSSKLMLSSFIKFVITCGICYFINVVVITLVLYINKDWVYFAQICGMGAYTISGFILNKFWVMK